MTKSNCELYAVDEKYRKGMANAIMLLLLDVYNCKRVKIGENYIPSQMVYVDLDMKSCIYNGIHEVDILL